MASPLQKAPRGLLSLFSLKDRGRNPQEFGDTVFPMSDVTDHYLSIELTRATANGNVTNSGDSINIPVPQGEIWRIRAIDAGLSVGTLTGADGPGLSIGLSLISASPTILATLQLEPKGAAYGATRSFRVCTGWLGRPILAPPGAGIYLLNDGGWSGAASASLSVMYELLNP